VAQLQRCCCCCCCCCCCASNAVWVTVAGCNVGWLHVSFVNIARPISVSAEKS
jgi:hypothetical protein